MAYPQGFLFPPLSSCPSVVLGPRAGHEGSAFAPYNSSSPHVPYGGEARAAAAISSFLSPGFEPSSSGLDFHPFGTTLGPPCHPYADPAYRKNATRDATATLKAWLSEHRKNPYPTKGEKIMLAIVTKMTLTQVSTWFANARRRLKKENKMTWTPRNRSEDEEEPDEEAERGEELRAGLREETRHHGDTGGGPCSLLLSPDPPSSDCTPHCSPVPPPPHQQHPAPPAPPLSPPPPAPAPPTDPPKPKLWSLAEMATSSDRKAPPPRPVYYPPAAYLYSHYALSGLYPRPDRDHGLRTLGQDKGEQQRLVPP